MKNIKKLKRLSFKLKMVLTREDKQRLEELEREFLMYKRQMNILSGLSNFNLI